MRRHALPVYLAIKAGFRRLVERAGTQSALGAGSVTRGNQTDFSRWASSNDEHVVETPRFAPLDVFADLLVETGDVALLSFFASLVGHAVAKLPPAAASGLPLGKITGQAMKETADVFARMGKALEDGTITAVEGKQLDREIDEAVARLLTMKAHIDAVAGVKE